MRVIVIPIVILRTCEKARDVTTDTLPERSIPADLARQAAREGTYDMPALPASRPSQVSRVDFAETSRTAEFPLAELIR